jgi:hypothetical protein
MADSLASASSAYFENLAIDARLRLQLCVSSGPAGSKNLRTRKNLLKKEQKIFEKQKFYSRGN